jgi:hypothetical protein
VAKLAKAFSGSRHLRAAGDGIDVLSNAARTSNRRSMPVMKFGPGNGVISAG